MFWLDLFPLCVSVFRFISIILFICNKHSWNSQEKLHSTVPQTADVSAGHLAPRAYGAEKPSHLCLTLCQGSFRSQVGNRTLRSRRINLDCLTPCVLHSCQSSTERISFLLCVEEQTLHSMNSVSQFLFILHFEESFYDFRVLDVWNCN